MRQILRLATLILLCSASYVGGQSPPAELPTTNSGWRTPAPPSGSGTTGAALIASRPTVPMQPMGGNAGPIARVSRGPTSLPTEAGQEWRDYDISPYTTHATGSKKPEQAVLDWVLRETGYEAWHGEPFSFISVNRNTLRVYHTPEMQAKVAAVVDRFVNSATDTQAFSLHVLSIGSPIWRQKLQRMLRPVPVQTQGTQAWLMAREDAAALLGDLRKRNDFREHSSPHLLVSNGQNAVVNATQIRNYVRDVALRADAVNVLDVQAAQFDEGFSLEMTPLMSLDGKTIDALVKCNVDQLERMIPVILEAPTQIAPYGRTKVEVPQTSTCRFQERFHWPTDQVLVISLGVIATPSPVPAGGLNLSTPLFSGAPRAELLVILESKGRITAASTPGPIGQLPTR